MEALFLGADEDLRRAVGAELAATGHALVDTALGPNGRPVLVEWVGGGEAAQAALNALGGMPPAIVALVRDATPERVAAVIDFGVEDWLAVPLVPGELGLRMRLLRRRLADAASRTYDSELYELLAEATGDGVAVVEDGRVVSANETYAQMFGLTKRTIVGVRLETLVAPESLANLQHDIGRECFLTSRFEYRGLRADGTTFPAEVIASSMREGNSKRSVGIARDLTQRRSIEEEHRTAAESLRLALEAARMGTWESDLTTGAVVWSESLERMYGVPRASFDGSIESFLTMVHPDDRALVNDAATRVASGDVAGAITYRIVLPTGAIRWFTGRVTAFFDGRGKPVRLIGAVLDVTDRFEREAQLREREERVRTSDERFRIVARATTDVVYDWVFDQGTVVWNDNVKALFGYDLPSSTSSIDWWSETIHPDDRPRVMASLDAAIAGGKEHWSDEYRFRRVDGSYGNVLDRGMFIADASGKPARMIGAMMDISERKEMQARLVVSDRMASVGTLAAGVAHEINNPLTYVIGSISLASRAVAKLATGALANEPDAMGATLEKLTLALDSAHEGAERVRHIVRDLKTFSRSDDEHRGLVDVRRVIESCISMAQNEIRHRAELAREFADVPSVEANESRLGQVLLNLLVNAAQAIPEGAATSHTIRVRTGVDATGFVTIDVEDSGAGIPRELLGRIFDPFFTTKAVGEGTGLGLAICHSIVKDMGGDITVTSEVGVGSTFRVRLPPARTSDIPPPPSTQPRNPTRRGTVLIVDDEPRVAHTLAETLDPEHTTVQLGCARDALDRLTKGETFDCIVCDLMMPEMTGMDLYDAVRALAPEQATRMIFLTGGAFTPRARQFLQQIPNRWLEKPYDPEALKAYVRELVT